MLSSSLAYSSLACKEITKFKWWTQPTNQFLKLYLFVLWSDSLKKQACEVLEIWKRLLCPRPSLCTLQLIPYLMCFQRSILQPLHGCSLAVCWNQCADFTAWGQGAQGGVMYSVVPLGCTVPNTWPCCTIARPSMEATWNWNRRHYKRSGKAWDN